MQSNKNETVGVVGGSVGGMEVDVDIGKSVGKAVKLADESILMTAPDSANTTTTRAPTSANTFTTRWRLPQEE